MSSDQIKARKSTSIQLTINKEGELWRQNPRLFRFLVYAQNYLGHHDNGDCDVNGKGDDDNGNWSRWGARPINWQWLNLKVGIQNDKKLILPPPLGKKSTELSWWLWSRWQWWWWWLQLNQLRRVTNQLAMIETLITIQSGLDRSRYNYGAEQIMQNNYLLGKHKLR